MRFATPYYATWSLLPTLVCFLAILFVVFGAGQAGELEKKMFRGTEYQVVQAKPADVQLHWKGADGNAIGTLAKLKEVLGAERRTVDMVMNAGIYTPDYAPEGLHIESGKELVGLNRKDGKGNFYLMPNGVFFIDNENRAGVVSTQEFSKLDVTCRLATQSGPLLLRGGRLHPRFNKDSASKKLRNGVGVDRKGNVWFACAIRSPGNVTNFYDFAEFFKSLGCTNALYLDGVISQMASAEDETPQLVEFAGMLSVSRRL